jgi:bla regulator protein BlaR1
MKNLESLYSLVPEPWVEALGWTFLHSLWQGALISLVLAGVLLGTRSQAPRYRYGYSFGALFLVLVAALGTFWWLFEPASGTVVVSSTPVIGAPTGSITWPEPEPENWRHYFEQHLPLIVVIWASGVFLLSLRVLGGLIYLRRLTTNQVYPVLKEWRELLNQLQGKSGVKRAIQLLASARVQSPMVVGIIKPVILFPLSALNQLSIEEVEAVLAHEIAHIRRHDFLLNLLQTLLETLFYFNPAVWWISSQIRTEREHCSDDLAVAWCGNHMQYARALLRIQELNRSAPHLAMALVGGKQNQLMHRIQRIFNQTENNRTIMEKITVTLLLGAILLFVGISASTPQQAEAAPSDAAWNWTYLDSVPQPRILEVQEIVSEENGQKVELRLENGEVKRLVVDGKEIAPAKYGDYQSEIDNLRKNMPAPPAPPAPPKPGLAPTPPAPPAPPQPGLRERIVSEQKVEVRRIEKDGMVILEVEIDEGEPMQIEVDEEREIILLDGEKLEDGDRKVIIRRDVQERTPGKDGTFFFRSTPDSDKRIIIEEVQGDNPFFWKEEIVLPEEPPQGVDKEEWERIREELETEIEVVRGLETEELRWVEEIEEEQLHRSGLHPNERVIIKELRGKGEPGIFFPGIKKGSTESILEAELQHDGFYQEGEGYKLELTDRKLVINGEKQSEAIHQKYRNLYEESTGLQLARKSRVVIEKER